MPRQVAAKMANGRHTVRMERSRSSQITRVICVSRPGLRKTCCFFSVPILDPQGIFNGESILQPSDLDDAEAFSYARVLHLDCVGCLCAGYLNARYHAIGTGGSIDLGD